jgi:hypothetical protein
MSEFASIRFQESLDILECCCRYARAYAQDVEDNDHRNMSLPAVDSLEGRDGLRHVIVENREILLLKITDGRPGGWTRDCIQIDSLAGMRSRVDLLGRDVGRRERRHQKKKG